MTDKHAAEAREKARREKNVYKQRALRAEAQVTHLLAALEGLAASVGRIPVSALALAATLMDEPDLIRTLATQLAVAASIPALLTLEEVDSAAIAAKGE